MQYLFFVCCRQYYICMSNDPTKDMGEKYGTKPTLETLLQIMIEMRNETRIGLAQIDGRLKRVENKIGVLNEDVLAVRADMRELKMSLTVHEQS